MSDLGNRYTPPENNNFWSLTLESRKRLSSGTLHSTAEGPCMANILNMLWMRSIVKLSKFVNIPTMYDQNTWNQKKLVNYITGLQVNPLKFQTF